MPRTILHLDLDAFFCAVEELRNPSLRGKAFAVGGKPEQRGVVASCSYAARQFGVRSAMPMARALKLCPELIVISHHHGNYGEMSDKVMERLNALSPLVEQISIDEAFVDISDIRDPAEVTARKIQTQIRTELGLPCSVGVASNKLVAKIATEVGKHSARGAGPPNAVTIVPAGKEAEFLAPLPVGILWGVGPKTAASLSELGIKTISDLAAWDEKDLVARFGEHGREMSRHARGISDSTVVTEHEVKSISQETTFSRDVRDDRMLETTLKELSAQVGRRLRRSDLTGKTVKLKIRWPDFTTLTRQATLSSPTDQDDEIASTVLNLMKNVRASGKPVRLIGVGISGLSAQVRQLELWGMESEKRRKFQNVIDELQEKFGEKTVHKGQRTR
jgi:DNA polymerase-4